MRILKFHNKINKKIINKNKIILKKMNLKKR